MKHLKMLAIAAVATGALMAFIGAGTASATVLCSTTVNPCPSPQDVVVGTVFDFSVPAGGAAELTDTPGSSVDACASSTIKGKITNTGSATSTVTGPIEELTWGGCTFPTKTIAMANLEVHRIAGTSNGTVTFDGATEVTFLEPFGSSCIYRFGSGASLGDFKEGNPPTFEVNAVAAKISGAFICPTSIRWRATYTMTKPETTLSVADSTA